LILKAASRVDYLPYRTEFQINLPHGVWRSLVIRGFLYRTKDGWEITPEGRAAIEPIPIRPPPEEFDMEKRLSKYRYKVERTHTGMWAVIDQDVSKIRMHNDVVDTFPSREAAREKCHELNDGEEHGGTEALI
jgi:hypothetical protein